MKAYTVTEINRYLKRLVMADPILNHVSVEGEISNFTRHTSGHCYFTLKDESSRISCVLFARNFAAHHKTLKNGDKVHAKGQISIYERDGKYQLYVAEIENIGLGALYAQFEALKLKLAQMGYFDEKLKKKIPEMPSNIGVITSPTGAAIQDIKSVATRRAAYSKLFIYPVRVQGEFSSHEIVKAIQYFNQKYPVDVILLARGGGSIEELWSFNEEIVAQAIFESRIPIITGIGHETDYTISDFVSDLRAPTPSAAAEVAVKSKDEIQIVINKTLQNMALNVNQRVALMRLKLDRFSEKALIKSCYSQMDSMKDQINRLGKSNQQTVKANLSLKKSNLLGMGNMLQSLSPLNTLERGYGIVQKEGGLALAKNIHPGDQLNIRLTDGILEANVLNVQLLGDEGGNNGNKKN
ncbi:exodeoxyribonuclease VII large subunit [Fusibacter tunisiensis]|nr:exodeoxyribonuclease VII large subunit [Fusibacter tunisiensis]